MTLEEALNKVVSRTGVERYRWLCSDENPDHVSRGAYRRLVMSKATGEPVPQQEYPRQEYQRSVSDKWTVKIRACPDYNPGCCSSPAPFCSRFLISPTREKCIECLSQES